MIALNLLSPMENVAHVRGRAVPSWQSLVSHRTSVGAEINFFFHKKKKKKKHSDPEKHGREEGAYLTNKNVECTL